MVGVAFICCTFVAKIKCHINPILQGYHASIIIDLYCRCFVFRKRENVYRLVLENGTATMFFSKNLFLVNNGN